MWIFRTAKKDVLRLLAIRSIWHLVAAWLLGLRTGLLHICPKSIYFWSLFPTYLKNVYLICKMSAIVVLKVKSQWQLKFSGIALCLNSGRPYRGYQFFTLSCNPAILVLCTISSFYILNSRLKAFLTYYKAQWDGYYFVNSPSHPKRNNACQSPSSGNICYCEIKRWIHLFWCDTNSIRTL